MRIFRSIQHTWFQPPYPNTHELWWGGNIFSLKVNSWGQATSVKNLLIVTFILANSQGCITMGGLSYLLNFSMDHCSALWERESIFADLRLQRHYLVTLASSKNLFEHRDASISCIMMRGPKNTPSWHSWQYIYNKL